MSQEEKSLGSLSLPVTDFNSLNLRINPEREIQKIEVFLKGERIDYIENEKGEIVETRVKVGLRQCNPDYVSEIISLVESCISTAVVQGNFSVDKNGYCKQYEDFKEDFRIDLSEYLIANIYDLEITEEHYNAIIFNITNRVDLFLTRLIGGKDRELNSQTLKTLETTRTEPEKRSLFS